MMSGLKQITPISSLSFATSAIIVQSHFMCDFKREMQLNNFLYVYVYAAMQVVLDMP